jgi:hypothetical protein
MSAAQWVTQRDSETNLNFHTSIPQYNQLHRHEIVFNALDLLIQDFGFFFKVISRGEPGIDADVVFNLWLGA